MRRLASLVLRLTDFVGARSIPLELWLVVAAAIAVAIIALLLPGLGGA